MGKVNWTKEQKDAIYEKDSNILVAAAAGSGKTAVLVERIINKIITDKIDIDRLLVVTFTNAAASEMRERVLDAIYKKLEENLEDEHLQRQITLLNKASICTIDSFCLEVVRNNFYELDNLSPNFRIADTTEIELLKQEVMEDIFENKYEEENKDFIKLINTYTSYRDDSPLKELILKIYSYIQSNPFPEKWLTEKIEMFNLSNKLEDDFSTTPWGKELLNEVEDELIDSIASLEAISKKMYGEPELEKFWQTIRNDMDKLQELKNNLDSWDKAYQINQTLKFVTWPRQKVESQMKDYAKQIRDDVKKKLSKVLDRILIYDSKQANQDIYDMYETLQKLKDMILEFDQEFSKRKREKNIVDFNDIEHLALHVLLKEENGKIKPSEVAKRYQEKYVEIAIDEYQDSNLVQEYILNSVSKGNNIFMVGDVKQSIYKFRQAMPELFLDKYRKYKNKEDKQKKDDLKIQLFKNFRSRDNILQFTNLIFQNIMSSNLGDIEYNQEEYLNLGADYPATKQDLKTEINIIDLSEEQETEELPDSEEVEERIEDIELEARFVANRMKELIDEKFQVWDRKEEQYRDITYKDIVVLLRSTSNSAPIYEQEILSLDMPVFSDSSQEYLESIEIQTILSLLKVIDNPMQDIPLVTVLRSYIGKFTDDELVQIRLSDKYDNFYTCMQKAIIDVEKELKKKIVTFFDYLSKWRKEQEYLALDELIWKIYRDTGFYNYVGLMPNGELRQANLKMLFQKAKQYESTNFKGLYNFINFIDKLRLSSGDLGSAKLIGEDDNVIRIMSIHKSKGLEFPVVFLSNAGKQFNLMDLNESVLLHQEMGIGAKYIDYDKQIQYDTLSKAAIKNKILMETLSEEMRILYVALTRAKEKLIITGIKKDYQKDSEKMLEQVERYSKCNEKITPILVKKYKKYLDWILLVYYYEKDKTKEMINLKRYKKQDLLMGLKRKEKENINVTEILEEKEFDYNQIQKIEKILNYSYPNQLATIIPTKTSVTNIKQMQQEEVYESKIELPKPEFLKEEKEEKLTGVQKGTLIHLCLQKLDEKKDYDLQKIKELISELEQKQIITSKEAESINPFQILEFTKSEIWKEVRNAKEVYREKPFYINIPAKEIYEEEIEESILVQGIIDLYFIDKQNNLILVDYKTDYVEKGKENELISKYRKQLDIYQEALEQAYNKKVFKKYIYSTWLGREIEV
jgi:ATP-dependent helicase/nuclease subunit A